MDITMQHRIGSQGDRDTRGMCSPPPSPLKNVMYLMLLLLEEYVLLVPVQLHKRFAQQFCSFTHNTNYMFGRVLSG